jgi:hypothetical protein
VQRFFDPACTPLPGHAPSASRGGCDRLRFFGTVSSDAANEYVSVLWQRCGSSGLGTSLVGAQTRAGGSWETVWGPATGTFRARWGAAVSAPVRFRGSMPLSLTKLSAFRHRVSVTGDQEMKGRIVELQRLAAGQWRTLRRVRLVADRSSYGVNSSATFTVRKRGLTLRALVPAKSASPCYAATASETWTSGVASGTAPGSGARVVDRTLLCSTEMQGGIRLISIGAASGVRAGLTTRGAYFAASTGTAQGAGLAYATLSYLSLNPTRCKPTRPRLALAPGKLGGGSPGASGRAFDCEVPPRVLLRVRAIFREPTSFESSRDSGYEQLSANGELKEASLAIRTPAGKQLAFATFSESGRARLHASSSCVEDT